jgi:hypothetical protein
MSLTSIQASTQDEALLNRISASIAKETFANPVFGNTNTGKQVQLSGPASVLHQFIWPLAIDFEADYSYAVDEGNPNPGGDPGVIGDDEIGSAVQTHWPQDPPDPNDMPPMTGQ